MAAPWFSRVVATDASEWGLGVVASSTSVPEMVSLMRLAGQLPDESREAPEVVKFAESRRWATIVGTPWRFKELLLGSSQDPDHINIGELRAFTTGIRWVLSHPSAMGSRVVLLSDSTVVVGAASKGRSSSFQVLRCLRRSAALMLAGGLRVFVAWIPSESNPADGPSRAPD